ncbi:type II secretion system F family protein [Vibrio sp. SCSIO 43136]|uniref:type II secretion system F family protein n=1 Tax=Vibrio sp. SCSIO 43136 TaxID=2819101 RepID=UPI0020760EFA|nr:type II secretion system F family protein [Vibrio sp. SCSIO 43136]USD66702.1 type II secretion system F family protein [Vibrio sp. SCSIO 43136]
MTYLVFGLIALGVVLLVVLGRKPKHSYLQEFNRTVRVDNMASDQAVNYESLTEKSALQTIRDGWINLNKQLGNFAAIKLIGYCVVLFFLGNEIDQRFIRGNPYIVIGIIEVLGLFVGYNWLQKKAEKDFEEAFPDALNMLASAVSAGESIMHAIIYVGKSLDGDVGAEFKVMGDRLQMGESPDDVFRKSCQRFPYASFQFFIITLRANMHRGGQLKDVMTRLNRLMFDARAIEKKKYALTSEARASAKIVAAIPFVFLLMLQYLSPENYEFVMFNEQGKPILYYMLTSEFIGITIIWMLMKGVR